MSNSSKHRACFGISFGNTNLCIAVHKDGKTDVVANDSGDRTTPAVVNFSNHEVCVGSLSKNRLLRQPKATIPGIKYMLGKVDSSEWASPDQIPCEAVDGQLTFTVSYEDEKEEFVESKVSCEQILTHYFKKLHDIAANQRGDQEFPTVITVPCEYPIEIRRKVRDSAEEAGFDVLRIINEPSAAALPYVNRKEWNIPVPLILVYRLGGKSSDITVFKSVAGVLQRLLSEHDSEVGGNSWTLACAKYAVEEFQRKTKVSWNDLSKRSKGKVIAAAEVSKHVLSTMESCTCSAESVHDGLDLSVQLTRARFEKASQAYLYKAKEKLLNVLSKNNLSPNQIHMVVLSGGGCRMSSIQKMFAAEFPSAEMCKRISPDEVTAVGASIEADILRNKAIAYDERFLTSQVEVPTLSESIQVQMKDGTVEDIFLKGSPVPCKFEAPILLGDDDVSVAITFLQEGELLAKLVMNDLNENSNLILTAEVSGERTFRVTCTDRTTDRAEQLVLE